MNRLALQKSPYLQQHAGNPVDWYPWGEEAFAAARREDKPIFLSIGYSTCHWCHVMEKESFADPEVAALMNSAFISIKVDREERPDLDEHFMTVSRLLTGSGGWPLTVLLTPRGEAFYSATYIPRGNAYGRLGMLDLVPKIREIWASRREEVTRSAEAITAEVARIAAVTAAGFTPGPDVAPASARALSGSYDSRYGGFGGAPKFPMPTLFTLLLRAWKRDQDPETLGMVEGTLAAMRAGGIYDQVGFGFHRYSTDERWLVPHFEKMLYDQALHVLAYTEAWQATGRDTWRQTAREICSYVMRDLAAPDGGFATAEDADSEGMEGLFYFWTEEDLRQVLGDRSRSFFERVRLTGGMLHQTPDRLAAPGEEEKLLLAARAVRVRPLRDDKILADWNGLMVAALARAGAVFGDPRLVQSAAEAAAFILRRMRAPGGGLFHRYRDGEAAIDGFADDYAFFSWGSLELYEATFDPRWLQECLRLTGEMLARFWDGEAGALFSAADSSGDGTEVGRRKSFTDGVIPSANSVAALLLLKLHRLTGRLDLRQKAERLISAFPETAAAEAISFSFLLAAADFAAGPAAEVVVAGDPAAADTRAMLEALRGAYLPNAVVILRDSGPDGDALVKLSPFTEGLRPIDGQATAYVCRDFTCSLPTQDPAVMLRLLQTPSGDTARP